MPASVPRQGCWSLLSVPFFSPPQSVGWGGSNGPRRRGSISSWIRSKQIIPELAFNGNREWCNPINLLEKTPLTCILWRGAVKLPLQSISSQVQRALRRDASLLDAVARTASSPSFSQISASNVWLGEPFDRRKTHHAVVVLLRNLAKHGLVREFSITAWSTCLLLVFLATSARNS